MERSRESLPDEAARLNALLVEKDDALARSAHQIEIEEQAEPEACENAALEPCP